MVKLCFVLCFVVGGTESDSTNVHFKPLALHKVKITWQKYLQATVSAKIANFTVSIVYINWVVFVWFVLWVTCG